MSEQASLETERLANPRWWWVAAGLLLLLFAAHLADFFAKWWTAVKTFARNGRARQHHAQRPTPAREF